VPQEEEEMGKKLLISKKLVKNDFLKIKKSIYIYIG